MSVWTCTTKGRNTSVLSPYGTTGNRLQRTTRRNAPVREEKLINKVSFMVCVPPVTIPPQELVYMLSYVVNTYKTAGKTYLIKIDEDEYTPNKNTGQ